MKRRRFSSLLGGTTLASLAGVPAYAEPWEGCGVLGMREDGWAVISVDHDKLIDRPALCEATDRLVASGANIHSILVARGGQLVFGRYFKGLDEIRDDIFGRRVANVAFDAGTLHNVKSVSKSVVSLAVGIAIDKGLIRGVNEPIFSFFPELSDLRTPEKNVGQAGRVVALADLQAERKEWGQDCTEIAREGLEYAIRSKEIGTVIISMGQVSRCWHKSAPRANCRTADLREYPGSATKSHSWPSASEHPNC